jgi:hypothetical protein
MLEEHPPLSYHQAVDAKLVELLARVEPLDPSGGTHPAGAIVQIHSNPAFGWHIARAFARARKPFPVPVIGRDRWLSKAYLMHFEPASYHDGDVDAACQISREPGIAAKLKALLMTGLGLPIDAHIATVAEKTGIPTRTVEAFEILFFNVLDRHQDDFYLSNVVYPEGRVVEYAEDYLKTTPIADLLLRTAYNHRNIDLVSHLAGLDDASFVKEIAALPDAEAKLQARFIGSALLMAKLGMLNQRSAGMQRATQLLAAGRHSCPDAKEGNGHADYDIAAELAAFLAALPPITETDHRDACAASRPGRSYWSDDSGMVYPIDPTDEESHSTESVDSPADPVTWFPEPVHALWRNKAHDVPVILVARMSEPGLPDHYLTDTKTGIPASEVVFDY